MGRRFRRENAGETMRRGGPECLPSAADGAAGDFALIVGEEGQEVSMIYGRAVRAVMLTPLKDACS